MKDIFQIDSVKDYNDAVGVETVHPLVSIVDMSMIRPSTHSHTHLNFGVYAVFLKESDCGEVRYGRNIYDYQEGTLIFIAPGQIVQITQNEPGNDQKGWALLFHPDLIHGTVLGKNINDYRFFSYVINEALHLSEREKKIVLECFSKISYEIEQRLDKHSKKLIVSNIQLFLDYCIRFYDRQFLIRENINRGAVEKFERILNEYLNSEQPKLLGIPSVGYFADKLNLSANYFGDLIKKETGKTPLENIHIKLVNLAKEKLYDSDKSINEIAYELGFRYQQHFTRMFKKETGQTPNEYRSPN